MGVEKMLFLKECRNVCCSLVYVLFLGLVFLHWHENFYGITEKEIQASKRDVGSTYAESPNGSLLAEPKKNAQSYGMKNKEIPEKIMCGGTNLLLIEYLNNSYASYPFSYYKEVVLDEEGQAEILEILCEITGLSEKQIRDLPDDYFPSVNGNIINYSSVKQDENGKAVIEMGKDADTRNGKDHTKQFISQVSYERFIELMAKAEQLIGKGSGYSMESLRQYYGLDEMTYEEAEEEYDKTIYDDKVSAAFARLYCDYMSRPLGLYPVFAAVLFWLKDRRNRMKELIDCRQIGTVKFVFTRFLALLAAAMLPVVLLSFESLLPLMEYSADTGIAVDGFAFIKYILWWLLPTAMIVTSLGMFLTIFTSSPAAVLVQLVWWFLDSSAAGLSGDTRLYTLMIRHNMLNGSELIHRDFAVICLNRGLFLLLSLLLAGLSAVVYSRKRDGRDPFHAG